MSKRKRKNPAYLDRFIPPGIEEAEPIKLPRGPFDKLLAESAGNLAVMAAVRGCSLEERMLVAAIIPILLNTIRAARRASAKPKTNSDTGKGSAPKKTGNP
jgi:hypothetical protein